MDLKYIRNFSIIAHVDHGKSTLADRLLELTHTIEKRKMQEQVLDSMELERERGITIKMKPVRMEYTLSGVPYVLNLIDTPGHIDFSYEVSRALKAVEGCILLVDATQGVQAQTLTTLGMAKEAGLVIVPVVSKIDSPLARIAEVKKEMAVLLGVPEDSILQVSGKTGQGVPELLREIVLRVPPPHEEFSGTKSCRSLIFDFQYSNHTGVIIFIRVFDGVVTKKDILSFAVAKRKFTPIELGIFLPKEMPVESLSAGEIGYIVTGIKEPGIASVGDTISLLKDSLPALPGYMSPRPVVWASLYPESQDDFDALRQALDRLCLSDSSFTHEEESSGLLGRGFRSGFLGMLHLEIITERLRREFRLELVVTTPSITYEVVDKQGKHAIVYSPTHFPEYGRVEKVFEPWASIKIITPSDYLGALMQLLYAHEVIVGVTESFGDNRTAVEAEIPLRELMRNFFDEIKSVSSGFASLSYTIGDLREADVVLLEILVADEVVPAFSRVVSRKRVEEEAEEAVEKLHTVLPRQLFSTKIQGKALGRIISSRTISALRKDVTGYLYGGDITRKKKLLEKQKKGKKKMKDRGRVNIPQEVFIKMMKKD
ncbi:MAG: elongation factor 4 [Candidatus Taylorbacteria bacterium RIFCSPHIGHO2_01_FULL_45_63]|uniref:Elongation factor 4 n=1 Tax=Candidatus Taylorbacteria bacterium RIFCSPHIGHO2_02_FULL_45_35 TaxID=1802311 RepID=A0A1G2MY35_9BACT|nr:MAG: elongation factor 4 [Candidatus Taylorbacteria bacterium RIFCSPHIGHO2_01_FULL_45_63]OHA27932.1 MAG: elongation factor 4 [Candidatus Taylorbacteria bacterium RIFCSPHIGHO2_02_FULL_45_35]OHA34841.1 MAG: elongation factor 4 [Candidatus Taylorbacteria bacterium RIFCSPLOWO2_01_FULL_45_34b]